MAGTSDKAIKDIKKQLDEFAKKADSKMLQKAIKEETKGIEGTLDKFIKETEIREQWRLATEQTSAFTSGLFEGLLGKDLGSTLAKKYAKANESEVKKAQSYFKQFKDKGEKGVSKKVGNIAPQRDVSFIKSQIVDIKQIVQKIERSMKPAGASKRIPLQENVKSGRYMFDPRMAGGGRYRDVETGDLVSAKTALAAAKVERSDRVGKMISADEDPMIRLADTVEEILKSLGNDSRSIHEKLNDLENKIESSSGGGDDEMDFDIDRNRRRTPQRPKPKVRSKFSRILKKSKIKGLRALRAVRTFAGTSAGTATIAATGAVAITAAGAYALDRGMTKVGEEAKGKMDVLQSKYGLKTIYKNGMAVGYEVQGKKYGLNDLPQEYKDLIEAYGPGDKRSFSAREALKRIKANPEKYKALEVGAKPAAAAAPAAVPSAGGAPPPPPAAPGTPTPVSGAGAVAGAAAGGVAGAISTAAKAPAAAVGAAPAPPPVTGGGPQRRLGPAAAKRGQIDPSAGKNAALAAAAKYGITGPHLAQFMAQIDHESSGFKHVEENLRYSAKRLLEIFPKYYKDPAQAEADAYSPIAIANRVYANRMGNGPPESGDGYRYRGRGLIQLTGKDNYKRFGQMAGVDLVSNPDMAGDLGTAADIAAAFYRKNVIDKGITGDDTKKVTKAINGGSIGLAHRETLFASYSKDPAALQAAPVSPGGPEPEPTMVAKGQDAKVGGGGGGEGTSDPLAKKADGTAVDSKQMVAAQPVKPVQNQTGQTMAQQSSQLASTQAVAQATPAATTVINNNSGGGGQQPVQAPKTPLPKASSRPTENAFNRALAKDFAHPTSFSSVAPV